MDIDQLVRMANDIGAFFAAEPSNEDAARGIHTHIKRFWDPRMRKQIVAHYREGGAGLTEHARAAIALLAAESQRPA